MTATDLALNSFARVAHSDKALTSRHADLIAGIGSKPIAAAIVRNSITSRRRSRPSTLAT